MVTSRKEQGVRRMLEGGWTWSGGSVKTSGRSLSWELKDAGEIQVGGGKQGREKYARQREQPGQRH